MASFLRRPSNTAANNAKKNIVRFGPGDSGGGAAPAKPPGKKGSFVSLFGGNNVDNNIYFDNGVDPLGRLSVDSTPPPPPSPIVQPAKLRDEAPPSKHWVDELLPLSRPVEATPKPTADLVARVHYFLTQKDPSALNRLSHVAAYAQQEGEPALNAKLFNRFGEGLPVRVPGQKPVHKDNVPVPRTLRELLRAFLREHDPGFLAIEGEAGLDDMLTRAAEFGMDSLESELCRKYGFGLNGKKNSARTYLSPDVEFMASSRSRDNSSFEQMTRAAQPAESSSPSPLSPIISSAKTPTFTPPAQPTVAPPPFPRLDKVRSEKPQTFVELGVEDEDEGRASKPLMSPLGSQSEQPQPRKHDFFDDKALRTDLKAFYAKHDQKKLAAEKFEPIVQWAYKIGPSELNRRFEEKYGESLNQFVEDQQMGRSGVPPGAKNVPAKTAEDVKEEHEAKACNTYREAVVGKSFGVCTCGFSRVDHHHITSLLVPGPEEPRFNKAKPKVIMSKNPATTPTSPSNSKTPAPAPVAQVQPSKSNPKAVITPAPWQKFEVKAEGKDGPCSDYRLDLEGRSFGVCKCGWSRPEHYRAKQQVAWAMQES